MKIYYKANSGMTYVQREDGVLYLPQKREDTVIYRQVTKKATNPLKLGLRYAGNCCSGISDWTKQELKKNEGN